MSVVLVLNGPNLNLLGTREPHLYGSQTLRDVEVACQATAAELGVQVEFRQSNHEGELVDLVQQAGAEQAAGRLLGAVFNPGGYGHTSIALHDAIVGSGLRVVEVHVSNVAAREPFRQHSFISPAAAGVIIGLGPLGYPLAVRALHGLARSG